MIRKFFSPPAFGTEDENFRAKFINWFAWAGVGLLSVGLIPYLISPGRSFIVAVLSVLIVVFLAALFLLRRGKVMASGWLIVSLSWLGIAFQTFTSNGVRSTFAIAFIAIGLLASIVINARTGSLLLFASVGVIALLAFGEVNGSITPVSQSPFTFGRNLGLIFFAIAILINLNATSLKDAVTRANQSEERLRTSNTSLLELNRTLEERIASRTAELEQANRRNERRARQFEAIAQVTKAATGGQSLTELLPVLVQVISDKFDYYHAGIFLLDDNREYAELRAANSAGGKKMLSRNHKLHIGQTGIVGYVVATGEPRIALDVGTDAVFFDNPDLPDTRSEMALPLKFSGVTIGALDIQSADQNAFTAEDIEVLSTLADQVATAIQNALYFETTQAMMGEAERMTGSYLRESWRSLVSQTNELGVVAHDATLKTTGASLDKSIFAKVSNPDQMAIEHGDRPSLALPIRLAGTVAGVMNINLSEDHAWETDEIDIAKAVAERLSLALEAATLLETTQKRAEIERLTSEISGKIGASTQFDSILRTAAEELSQALGGSDVLVQINAQAPQTLQETSQLSAEKK
ncbi:MAG: GAF domain-containing protein [Anaerolineales bacterium]|nr:GAF domain-containing protein [Anaerolineales bacterium]